MPTPTRPAPVRSRCVFRIAAGPRVGYGHLMRARALAQCLDMEVAISVRGGRAAKDAADSVGPLVTEAAALRGADVLVVDDPSRKQGRSWVARARRCGVRSVSIHDDLWAHDADLVVCGSLGADLPSAGRRALRGTRFYLLDWRIGAARLVRARRQAGRQLRVVVALGGGQHVRRVAQRLVDAIADRCPTVKIVVAAGFSRARRPALARATWLEAPDGLMRALLAADVAVVAGGVTLYEACALGVPAVGLAVVPEQRRAIRAFARLGALIDAGGETLSRAAIHTAAAGVARLVENDRLRTAVSSRARALVDGLGAQRVARRIQGLLAGKDRRRA
jgi:spore coat polysaccharide biosynthesis predicted glycosyltransferase SpsG